jgi:hypothetical protein
MSSGTVTIVKAWDPASSAENLAPTDYVVALRGSSEADMRTLAQVGGIWKPLFSNITGYIPDTGITFVYGITDTATVGAVGPRMPFNRADYYILTGAVVPGRCAPNTGVLVRSVVKQTDGTYDANEGPLPLLDCVADMKVLYRLDTDANGSIDQTSDNISTLTADKIRKQVREVRIYILAHEGQKDTEFSYGLNTIPVGEFGLAHNFAVGTALKNYRWKLYIVVVQPKNMRQ